MDEAIAEGIQGLRHEETWTPKAKFLNWTRSRTGSHAVQLESQP